MSRTSGTIQNKSLCVTYVNFMERGVSKLLLIFYLFNLLISILALKRE
jgi:hypothetical protein